mmetsp:Transcript_54262/g.80958  ORF Transcript_54262/g.80958 Transcript_54262/m.80958 type:complete len:233 (+) Transcript_54262:1667-2365(+)
MVANFFCNSSTARFILGRIASDASASAALTASAALPKLPVLAVLEEEDDDSSTLGVSELAAFSELVGMEADSKTSVGCTSIILFSVSASSLSSPSPPTAPSSSFSSSPPSLFVSLEAPLGSNSANFSLIPFRILAPGIALVASSPSADCCEPSSWVSVSVESDSADSKEASCSAEDDDDDDTPSPCVVSLVESLAAACCSAFVPSICFSSSSVVVESTTSSSPSPVSSFHCS